MRIQTIFYTSLLAVLLLTACDSFLTQESENNTTVYNHFQTEEDAEAAVYGMHERFREVVGKYDQNYRDRGMLLDNFGLRIWGGANKHDFSGYSLEDPILSWLDEYFAISATNLVICNIHRSDMPEERYRFYMGQALCIRAYLYFQLIRFFGDVPLVLDYEDLSEKGRTPWQEIARQIVGDLELAAAYLPTEDGMKDSRGMAILNKQIPCRGTAYAILAHVYAWMAGYGQQSEYYAKGIEAAGKVIADPNYSLVDSPEEICTEVIPGNSREGIFELNYSTALDEVKSLGSYFAYAVETWPIRNGTTPATRRKYFILNSTVEGLYSQEDLRLAAFFADFQEMKQQPVSITQGAAYVRMWRYLEYYSGGISDGKPKAFRANELLIRLADVILLRAEMEAATGDREAAIADLNVIRRRAGIAEYRAGEGDLRRAIQLERDRELLFQTNVRYFDYMRNHTYNLLKGGFRELTEADVEAGALFLPVSTYAIDNNPGVKQYPYWVGKF